MFEGSGGVSSGQQVTRCSTVGVHEDSSGLNCVFSRRPAGAEALLSLVPKLMLKLTKEEDEEVQLLLLSTLTHCSRLDALPGLASDGVSLLGRKLSHRSSIIRREAAAAMMALR